MLPGIWPSTTKFLLLKILHLEGGKQKITYSIFFFLVSDTEKSKAERQELKIMDGAVLYRVWQGWLLRGDISAET